MAKKKSILDLRAKNIKFDLERLNYHVQNYNPNTMTLDVLIFENGIQQGVQNLPFAHLPKEIKKIINPK